MADVDRADTTPNRAGRVALPLLIGVVATVAGWLLFVRIPSGNLARLLGVLAVLGVVGAGLRAGTSFAQSLFAPYNVAEVAVEGPITRDGGSPIPTRPGGTPADDVVEQIERADADDNAAALIVRLNTPGGEVVPSEDIRSAAADFDGPTVAYATDTCASGGYWIAAGCDRILAREGSVVGSIGVLGSRPNVADLADRLGVQYEQLTAGEYKDAGNPLKEFTDEDRSYLQGLVDDYYEQFVQTVAAGRDLDEAVIRDTEARVFLGDEAAERGLVDAVSDREGVEDHLEDELDAPVTVREFEPTRGVTERIGLGARRVAYAAGAGVASTLAGEGDAEFRFR